MLKLPSLFATSIIVTLTSWTGLAKASEKAVGFSLALPSAPQQVAHSLPEATLPSQPVDMQTLVRHQEILPPLEKDSTEDAPSLASSEQTDDKIELSFDAADEDFQAKVAALENEPSAETESAEIEGAEILAKATENAQGLEDWIFKGGADSLVARTVGSAEGTRHWSGAKTPAYYGHTDPGNGVWNRGTFSYQHEAHSPEEADDKQLQRLKLQSLQLEEQAQAQGLKLTLEEKLNGVDLANQAPLAALDRGGYIEQLAKARRLNMEGTEAIVYARTWAYLDPDTRQWNAPGLGNTIQGIDRDQRRRAAAIAQAYQAYSQPGTDPSALSKLDEIHVVDAAAEQPSLLTSASEALSFELSTSEPPISLSIQPQPSAPNPQLTAKTAISNLPTNSLSESPDLGVQFSATDDNAIAAVVDANTTIPEVMSVPPIAESFAADTAAEPASSDVAAEAIAVPTPTGGEIAELPLVSPTPDQPRVDDEAPKILRVPPVAPPIGNSAQDAPENEPIRQRLWRLEDKADDESVDEAKPALSTGK